jgi:hypothetical protein
MVTTRTGQKPAPPTFGERVIAPVTAKAKRQLPLAFLAVAGAIAALAPAPLNMIGVACVVIAARK